MTKKNKRIISVVLILFFITVIGLIIYCNFNPEKSAEEQLDDAVKQSLLNDYADNCENYEESFAKAETDAKDNNWTYYKQQFYKCINSPFKYIMFNLDKLAKDGSVLTSYVYDKTASDETLDIIFKGKENNKPALVSYMDNDYQLVQYAYVDENCTRYYLDENGDKVIAGIEFRPVYLIPDKDITVRDVISHIITGDIVGYETNEDGNLFINTDDYSYYVSFSDNKIDSITVDGQYTYSFLDNYPQLEITEANNYTGKEYYIFGEDVFEITMEFMYDFLPEDYEEQIRYE